MSADHEPQQLGGPSNFKQTRSAAKQVSVNTSNSNERGQLHSFQTFLYSSDEEPDDTVRTVRVQDKGSKPQCTKVEVQGVPAYGILDSDVDITIMGGVLFRNVAAVARLKKRDLKKSDKTTRNYDQTSFNMDSQMDLDIIFEGRTMCTPVYIKSDAHEQLLLSEEVCRQLGILQYHTAVEPWRGRRKQNQSQASTSVPSPLEKNTSDVPKDLSCTFPQPQSQSPI